MLITEHHRQAGVHTAQVQKAVFLQLVVQVVIIRITEVHQKHRVRKVTAVVQLDLLLPGARIPRLADRILQEVVQVIQADQVVAILPEEAVVRVVLVEDQEVQVAHRVVVAAVADDRAFDIDSTTLCIA